MKYYLTQEGREFIRESSLEAQAQRAERGAAARRAAARRGDPSDLPKPNPETALGRIRKRLPSRQAGQFQQMMHGATTTRRAAATAARDTAFADIKPEDRPPSEPESLASAGAIRRNPDPKRQVHRVGRSIPTLSTRAPQLPPEGMRTARKRPKAGQRTGLGGID